MTDDKVDDVTKRSKVGLLKEVYRLRSLISKVFIELRDEDNVGRCRELLREEHERT